MSTFGNGSPAFLGSVLLLSFGCSPSTGHSNKGELQFDASQGSGGGTHSFPDGGNGNGGMPIVNLPDGQAGGGGCDACTDGGGPACGNGILEGAEVCDDGNTASGDGCVGTCTAVENDYACPLPGDPCVSTVKCGDGKIGGAETCDDGNTTAADGCDAACSTEPGWACPAPGSRCRAAACGDGLIAGNERCDDKNAAPGDGCDATCRLEPGWACDAPAAPCRRTVCGDGTREGSEQCDDANRIPFDGCSPDCTSEPECPAGGCVAVCGDGLLFPNEVCDDGNTTAGDGCSADCQLEPGYDCKPVTDAAPSQLVIPIVYRDFLYHDTAASIGPGHPDFEWHNGGATGLVQQALGGDGKPGYASSTGSGGTVLINDATSFYWWYHDTQCTGATCTPNPYGKLVYLDAANNPTTLTLTRQGNGSYQFSSSAFFPVNNLGWVDASGISLQTYFFNNFSFTSELHYAFTYQGGEVLNFTGDDDVWVFINGQLAVDLGGVHGPTNGSITLDGAAATRLGLTIGSIYEIALFQAERHTSGSNYTLSLGGFVHSITQCQSKCGDGIVTPDELCDDGTNAGAYGGCAADCQSRGPYCGDGTVQPDHEACDDGVNLSPYGGCAPGCVLGGKCGDGKVDSRFGEQCDDGVNAGTYGGCASDCKLGPHCGDRIVQRDAGEECDDGNTDSTDGCTVGCRSAVPQ